ncbi:hypothetical protein PSD17_66730 [Pseudonocardia sp. D17]|nr:hypothetical protein PSD17_66730 [Pseudonocardia sp. D17]
MSRLMSRAMSRMLPPPRVPVRFRTALLRRARRLLADDAGMSTVEYALYCRHTPIYLRMRSWAVSAARRMLHGQA